MHNPKEIFPEINIIENEPMSRHTTMRIGGEAQFFARPDEKGLIKLLDWAKNENVNTTILGRGSNVLVSDDGIAGLVISVSEVMGDVSVDGTSVQVGAGASLIAFSKMMGNIGLSGLEFASGIPGSVGGAAYMNAGAYGGEMADVITSVNVLTKSGKVETWNADSLDYSYRHSKIMDENAVVLSVNLKLMQGDRADIIKKMDELKEMRNLKQPMELPSAGSFFKRPKDNFAGKLIEDAGLRGFRVGDAAISEKHCGFVVNLGNATCKQVIELKDEVTRRVYEMSGVTLEPEVRFL